MCRGPSRLLGWWGPGWLGDQGGQGLHSHYEPETHDQSRIVQLFITSDRSGMNIPLFLVKFVTKVVISS